MNCEDIIGLSVLLLVFASLAYGLHRLTLLKDFSKEAHEERVRKSSGVMNALMYPLQELRHPKAAEAVRVIKDLKAGYYDAQQEHGDDADPHKQIIAATESVETISAPPRKDRLRFFGRLLKALRRRS